MSDHDTPWGGSGTWALHHRAGALGAGFSAAQARRPPADPGELEQLLIHAAACDHDAWARLMTCFTPRIRHIARAYRLSAHDADDLVQTTWLELLTHIRRLREPAKVGCWLATAARRQSVRMRTAAQREKPLDEAEIAEPSVAAEGQERIETQERSAALADALERLPRRQRRLLQALFANSEPSYAVVSATLHMPLGSIGPTQARALQRLRADAQLAHSLGYEPPSAASV
jgi:RNA polymerase sigma factor (sigma-70 family)